MSWRARAVRRVAEGWKLTMLIALTHAQATERRSKGVNWHAVRSQ